LHLFSASDSGVKVLNFEPENYAISVRPKCRIAEWPVVMHHFPLVELEDESFSVVQALVIIATMPARATEQLLVPEATRLDVMDTDKRGKLHGS
jgi:hypothetical protein